MSGPSSKPSHTGHLVPESPTHFYHRIPGLFGKPIGVLSLLCSSLPPPPLVWIPHSIFIWVVMGTLVSHTPHAYTHFKTHGSTCSMLYCVFYNLIAIIKYTQMIKLPQCYWYNAFPSDCSALNLVTYNHA